MMMISELRFPSPGWKFYIQGILLSLLGAGMMVLGVVIVVVDPWDWAGIISMLGGTLFAGVGLLIFLFVWFTVIYGTTMIWRRWGQLRQPAAIIDAEGVRYLARRRPTRVPWQDIEEIHVDRALLPGSVSTKVTLRLIPGAALVHDGPVKVPPTRYLNIGAMSDLAVPEDMAQQFLSDTAGPRLRVTETDRRTPSATHGYR